MRLHRSLPPILFILFLLFWPALVHADFQAALDAYEKGDYATALKELRPLAAQGHAVGQLNLGSMYYHGRGVPQDYGEAARWYRQAAAQGHAEAQSNLGVMYDHGRGVPQDDAEAARWYRQAAAQGHAEPTFKRQVHHMLLPGARWRLSPDRRGAGLPVHTGPDH